MDTFRGKTFDYGPLRSKVIPKIPSVPRGWILPPSFIDSSLFICDIFKESNHSFMHSFIHSGYLYSALSRNLLRGALSPATVKEKCLKKLAERRHVVLR